MPEKEVYMFNYGTADFNIYDSMRTNSLDRCIGVLTYSPERNLGSIAHLTIESDVKVYIEWLRKNIPIGGTKVYLVGGTEPLKPELGEFFDMQEGFSLKLAKKRRCSNYLVQEVESQLVSNGYNILKKDLFGKKTRNVILLKDGSVKVEYKDYSSDQLQSKFL